MTQNTLVKTLKNIRKYRKKLVPLVLGMIVILTPIAYLSLKNTQQVKAGWWDGDATSVWAKRKQLTLTNDSTENLAANITVAITVDTSALINGGKLQDDCDDLRVVHDDGSTQTELTRHLVYESGTTCSTSKTTKVHFPLQAAINTTATDNDYYMYYKNSDVSAPSTTVDSFDVGAKNALLVCPFNGTTECINGDGAEDPTTETGAIRYGGAKTAMEFSGSDPGDDYVNFGSAASLADVFDGGATVEMWVYLHTDGDGGVDGKLISKESYRMSAEEASQYLEWRYTFDTNIGKWRTPNGSFTFNAWNHIAVYYDSSSDQNTPIMYINGVSQSLNEIDTPEGTRVSDSADNLCIGGNCGGNAPVDGVIDEVRISNVKRYASNFSPPLAPFTRDAYTVILLHLDENGDDPRNTGKVYDDSDNGNDGTITGAKYVEGLVGINNGTTDTGNVSGSNSFAGHEGVFIEDNSTNKITNPSFEYPGDYDNAWDAVGADLTVSENTSSPYYKFGNTSAKIVSAGTDNDITITIDPDSTATHTLSTYVYNGTSGDIGGTVDNTVAQLVFESTAQSGATYTDAGGGWWRIDYSSATTDSANEYGLEVADTKTVYIDGVQLEEKGYATTYTDGTLGTGYSWSGATNDSTSTRSDTDVVIASSGNIQASAATISFWIKPDFQGDDGSDYLYFLTIPRTGGANNNRIQIYKNQTSNALKLVVWDSSSDFKQIDNIYTSQLTQGKWNHLVGYWDGAGNIGFYLNGVSVGSATGTGAGYPSSLANKICIMGNCNTEAESPSSQGNSELSDIRIFDDDLTAAEITDLYQAGLVAHSQGIEVDAFSSNKGQDPVAIWHFDESYGTTASDASQYGNHLTVSGASWETMSVGGRNQLERVLSFDGTDDYLTRSADSDFNFGTEGFSISGWFRHSSTISGTDTILARYDDAGYKVYMDSSGYICFGIDDDDTSFPEDTACTTATQGSFADSRWHHFEAVKDGTTSITIYIDAIQITQNSSTTADSSLNDNTDLWIGIDTDGSSNPWDGDLDEIIIYPYARTADQVKTDVLGGQRAVVLGESTQDWLSDGLVGYWKMDETTSDTCTGGTNDNCDSSGNGNDGLWGGLGPATSGAGKFGAGVSLGAGNNDNVGMGNASVLDFGDQQDFTISTWIYHTADAPDAIVTKRNTEVPTDAGYSIEVTGANGIEFQISDGTDELLIDAATAGIALNTWYHIVAVLDEDDTNNSTVYIDSVDSKTSTTGTLDDIGSLSNSNNFQVGLFDNNSGDYSGTIDETRVYNRALSPVEVEKLYNWAPGPVGYWPLDENTGTTSYDKSGNGNSGAVGAEAKWLPGKVGGSLQTELSNINAKVVITHNNVLNPAHITFSTWMNLKDYPQGSTKGIITKKEASSNISYRLQVLQPSEDEYRISCQVSTDGTTSEGTDGTNITINENVWYFVSCTYDGSSLKIYVDGILKDTDTGASGDIYSGTADIELGSLNEGSGNTVTVALDEVRIYNYARTQKQIIEDMNAGHPAPGSPVGSALLHYKFDEGYGDAVNDSGTGGNNGDLGGGDACPTGSDDACPTWTNSGKFGKALDFDTADATDDYISVADANNLDFGTSTDFTVSAWVTKDDSTGGQILFKGQEQGGAGSDGSWALLYNASANSIRMYVTSDTWNNYCILTGATDIADGNWHHVVGIVKRNASCTTNDILIFVDGVQESTTKTGSFNANVDIDNDDPLTIGAYYADGAYAAHWNGKIDDVQIYTSALTSDQVKLLYNQGYAAVFGATSTDSSGVGTWDATNAYCPPGQGSTCTPPVGHWNFDEKQGLYANDISGNGNQGTLGVGSSAPTWVNVTDVPPNANGLGSSALEFDGSDDYVSVTDNDSIDFDYNEDFSVSYWVYDTGSAEFDAMVEKWNGSGGYPYAFRVGFGEVVSFIRYDGTNIPALNSTSAITDGEWHHIVGTKNGSALKLYFDGVEEDSDTDTTTTTTTNNSPLCFGARCTPELYFAGQIDQVRIYDYARTPAQIAWEYNRGGPIGWWKFNECQGTIAYDSGSGGNNGTISAGDTSGSNDSVGTCSSGAGDEMWDNGTTGRRNASLDFDQTNDDVDLGDAIIGDMDTFTISGWVNTTNSAIDELAIYAEGRNADANCPYVYLEVNDDAVGDVVFGYRDDGCTSGGIGLGNIGINDGNWHHIVGVQESENSRKLYVDGKLRGTDTTNVSGTVNTNKAHIGAHQRTGGLDDYMDGQIDDVKIFNYALTSQQIKTQFNEGAVKFD